MKKIAVVGGGITGLTAAFRLQQAGLHPLVFEAGKRPGGVVDTQEAEGYLFETGPNSLQESPKEVGNLIRALELDDAVVEANPSAKNRYILKDGRPVPLPFSPVGLLRTPLLSWKGKLRVAKEPFVAQRPDDPEESLADFVRRRLGPEVLDYLVNPFVAGIFAGDPEKLSTRHAMPKLFALESEHGSLFRGMRATAKSKKANTGSTADSPKPPRLISFRSGLGQLTGQLAEQLRKNTYLETTVESITAREGRWQLIASRYGRQIRDTYDAVILALPARALARITFEKDEQDFSLALLNEISYPPVASVSLGFRRDQVRHPLDGFGMLVPEREEREILGTLFASTLFPDRAPKDHVLLTSFLGGSRQPEMANEPQEKLPDTVLEDLRPLLGISGDPVFSRTCVWPEAIPQYNVGYGRFLQALGTFETENPGLFVGGACRDGISLGQCIASGDRQAERTRNYLA